MLKRNSFKVHCKFGANFVKSENRLAVWVILEIF